VVYESTTSTQDLARKRFESMGAESDGSVIIAGNQTSGRGRLGRSWTAPPGTGVLFSLIHAPEGAAHSGTLNVDRLVLVTAVAVAQGIDNACGPDPLNITIKWPNDLMVGNKKIGGILVETVSTQSSGGTARAAIIGVGVNVGFKAEHLSTVPADVADRVTSLALHHRSIDRLDVLDRIIEQMEKALYQTDLNVLLEQWRRRSTMLGIHTRLLSEGREISGQVIDIDPLEGLIVRTSSGEIVHLRAATTSVIT